MNGAIPPRRNPFRDEPTAVVLLEAEIWRWQLAELETDLAQDPLSWTHPDGSRAFMAATVEDADAELARRERLRHHPAAPAWPTPPPDRRAELDEIKARIDLESLIFKYAPVRFHRNGNRLRCICPLPGHQESEPSFVVYEDQQRWHCFGCGRGGDCFEFVRQLLGFPNFADAVDFLAHEAGVERTPARHRRGLRVREVRRA